MKFDALFARDTRLALAEKVQTSQVCAAQCFEHVDCFCVFVLRAAHCFGTKIAKFCGRKPRDFCVEICENQRDRSRRRPQNAGKTLKQSFDACCAGRAGFSELTSVFSTEICGKVFA